MYKSLQNHNGLVYKHSLSFPPPHQAVYSHPLTLTTLIQLDSTHLPYTTMFNLQAPVIRQFIQHIASKFHSPSTSPHDDYDYYNRPSNKTPSPSLYSPQDAAEDDEKEDYFRYAPSSIYSADSFCGKSITTSSSSSSSTATVSSSLDSVFEKTYVSFPDFTPSTTSNRALFTRPEVMTATATPLFYNTPHSKPIWIA